jgi:uncharacterized protein YcaQ
LEVLGKMDEEIVKQILDELFSSFEDSETRSAALLLFLKDQGIATQEKLAPYFEQAANTSEVRWRAARARMGALITSALKTPEPAAEKKISAAQEKKVESAAGIDAKERQTPERKSDGPTNEAEGAIPPEDAI